MTASISHLTLLGLAACVAAQDDPSVRLIDTVTPLSAVLSNRALDDRDGWQTVPEGNVSHRFKRDAIILNDRLMLVVRKSGSCDVYSRTAAGTRLRARVSPASEGSRPSSDAAGITIVQNDPSAVKVDVAARAPVSAPISLSYRLSAGQACLEMTPGEGISRLTLRVASRYTVVPDFFGDDMVFGADAIGAPRTELPAESLLLHLIEGGNALAVCVWKSRDALASVRLTDTGVGRRIVATEVTCAKREPVWLALIEGERIWTDRPESWRPPFPAKWRLSVIREEGMAESSEFTGQRLPDGQRAVIYPIDRSRTTPLAVFCPTDVMRNTLGCGPCQYLLDREGLDAAAHATPADVTKWVERQFKRKRAKRNADQIEQRLKLMVEHVQHADARISQYESFARQVQSLCAGVKDGRAEKIRGIAEQMARGIASHRERGSMVDLAARLGDQIVALVGKPGAPAECESLGEQMRAMGAAQDRALSRCRLRVRRIKLLCRGDRGPHVGGRPVRERILELVENALNTEG